MEKSGKNFIFCLYTFIYCWCLGTKKQVAYPGIGMRNLMLVTTGFFLGGGEHGSLALQDWIDLRQ